MAIHSSQRPVNELAEIPPRDPGLFLIPALGLACVISVFIGPALVAIPLAVAAAAAAVPYRQCMEARAVKVSTGFVAAGSALVTVVAGVRPALFLFATVICLFAAAVISMTKLEGGGVADSLFASFLGIALLGIAPSHLALIANSPFAGGETTGRALAVVVIITGAAALGAASFASHSLQARSTGGAILGGELGADLAGLLSAILVSLIASTIKRPRGSALDYLLLAVVVAAVVAAGRRLTSTLTSGGTDVHEIVWPQKIGDAYSLKIFVPISLSFAATYYLAKIVFV